MVANINDKVIRDLQYAIIDEADSVLIDEARTPLIIAGQPKKDISLYIEVDEFVRTLVKEDYDIDPETRSIFLTQSGTAKAQQHYHLNNLYDIENSDLVHKIRNALMANYVFTYGVEYIVQNQKILLVDHFTGRILHGRSYNAGLHQAIQAKEKVKIDPENVIVATITYQSFFRLYKKIAGVSGTAYTEAKEFLDIYNMVVVPVPTNKKVIRKDYNDYVFETTKAKRDSDNGQAERDAFDNCRQPQPKSSKHYPNDIQDKCARAGVTAADYILSKWEKGKTSNPKRRDAIRNAYNCAAEH